MSKPQITTVDGVIEPSELGVTLMHEHVFLDGSGSWWDPSGFEPKELTTQPLTVRSAGLARWDAVGIRDNLTLDPADLDEQVMEMLEFKDAGGSCLVDMTNVGLAPAPEQLLALSLASGIHVVASCGFYVHETHPAWVDGASRQELEEYFDRELSRGIGETGILPGIIGEIGTSEVLYPCEVLVLQAAAALGSRTGTVVNVHTTVAAALALEIVDIAADAGLDPARIYLSHVEERLDPVYNATILRTGAVLGFDSFGCDVYYGRQAKSPSDLEKMRALVAMLDLGFEDQIVLGHDTGMKVQLKRFGGLGYDHVVRRIVPTLMSEFGVTRAMIDKLLISNPRRLLSREAATSSSAD